MFSRIRTERYTDGCSQAERLRAALDGANAVVIGAGSGLSTAAASSRSATAAAGCGAASAKSMTTRIAFAASENGSIASTAMNAPAMPSAKGR